MAAEVASRGERGRSIMPLSVLNLAYLRNADPNSPGYGARLYEALLSIQGAHNAVESQTNSNSNGQPEPPPNLDGILVTPTSVGHHISIQHGGEFYRGIEYHGDYADNPQFTNPFPWHAGPARELDLATGSKKLYFRAQGQYPTGSSTPPVYHGGSVPVAVTGGADVPLGLSQGSGTGIPGEGLQGFGALPYRTNTGTPPVRKS